MKNVIELYTVTITRTCSAVTFCCLENRGSRPRSYKLVAYPSLLESLPLSTTSYVHSVVHGTYMRLFDVSFTMWSNACVGAWAINNRLLLAAADAPLYPALSEQVLQKPKAIKLKCLIERGGSKTPEELKSSWYKYIFRNCIYEYNSEICSNIPLLQFIYNTYM